MRKVGADKVRSPGIFSSAAIGIGHGRLTSNWSSGAEARAALQTYPGGLQIGGGVNLDNARGWLEAGASHVIVTSWVFRGGQVDWERLSQLVRAIGKQRLVLDLSCRRRGEAYFVVTDRWQKFTDLAVSRESLQKLAAWCAEFLIHAVDVEGQCHGIDQELGVKVFSNGGPASVPTLEAWAMMPSNPY